MFHYQLFYSVQLAFLVLESIFDCGVFQKNLIFFYLKKNGVFAKNSWLNFLTNNVFIIQVYLFIRLSLGSIKLDRVISETRYSDLGKGGYKLKLD